ncbi:uncharacterized protein M6B38_293125 [Iris pallida]|uniref:Zinc knuckle CX2CX4HX4C domain-containing protein n=1 Tax=Iris pallida TaxID=29817 RepID=A0AAX6HWA7_IRIPA|nr:uncharacterized protein M6B38_293125 [Iris pallida]
MLDRATEVVSRPSCSQVLVDIDISKPLRSRIRIKLPDEKSFWQDILYEERTPICSVCFHQGHRAKDCKFRKPLWAEGLSEKGKGLATVSSYSGDQSSLQLGHASQDGCSREASHPPLGVRSGAVDSLAGEVVGVLASGEATCVVPPGSLITSQVGRPDAALNPLSLETCVAPPLVHSGPKAVTVGLARGEDDIPHGGGICSDGLVSEGDRSTPKSLDSVQDVIGLGIRLRRPAVEESPGRVVSEVVGHNLASFIDAVVVAEDLGSRSSIGGLVSSESRVGEGSSVSSASRVGAEGNATKQVSSSNAGLEGLSPSIRDVISILDSGV